MDIKKIKTLGQLKKAGYKSLSVKEELRKNLIERLQSGQTVFEGIIGFEDTVMASSSMDYAKESGFRSHDGAKILYKNALSLI